MSHRWRHRRERPSWWPANEPWPPTGPPSWVRGGDRRRFLWRAGALLAVFLVLMSIAISIAFWVVASLAGFAPGPPGDPGPPSEHWRAFRFGPVIFLFLFVAIAFVVRAFRRTAAPIGDLIEAAHQIETGDYSVRVAEDGPREVRALARSFNAMSERLQTITEQRRSALADVTHELRTPLTVIQGNIEGLIDGVYPADQARLSELLEETRVLSRLIDDLGTLALAEAGTLTLRREPTDVAAVVAETVGAFRPRADAAGVSLDTELAPSLPSLQLDPARIRQVLENLLANALRYTPPDGRIAVRCSLAEGHPGQPGAVMLEVEDTGAGIDPMDLPHIFERFYRAGSQGGTGLGLAIVKDLVEAHGGQVSAISSVGTGTTIRCGFPAS